MKRYGYSLRDGGVYWYRTDSGLKNTYRGRERFRYALRNEYNLPAADVDRIVNECTVDKHERMGGAQ